MKRPALEVTSLRLARLWWIGVLLSVGRWHGRQHDRLLTRCERELHDMGVSP